MQHPMGGSIASFGIIRFLLLAPLDGAHRVWPRHSGQRYPNRDKALCRRDNNCNVNRRLFPDGGNRIVRRDDVARFVNVLGDVAVVVVGGGEVRSDLHGNDFAMADYLVRHSFHACSDLNFHAVYAVSYIPIIRQNILVLLYFLVQNTKKQSFISS